MATVFFSDGILLFFLISLRFNIFRKYISLKIHFCYCTTLCTYFDTQKDKYPNNTAPKYAAPSRTKLYVLKTSLFEYN